jgi:hypothetical protein
MKQIAVRVDDDLLAAIEKARGDVPREPWMRGVLRAATSGGHGLPQTQGTAPTAAPARVAVAPVPLAPDLPAALCSTCERHGPPRHRACPKCGARAASKPRPKTKGAKR